MTVTCTSNNDSTDTSAVKECLGQECEVCPIGPYGVPDCPDAPAGKPTPPYIPPPVFADKVLLLPLPATPERFRFALGYHQIAVRYDVRGMRNQVRIGPRWEDSTKWEDLTDAKATIVQEMLQTLPFPCKAEHGKFDNYIGGCLDLNAKSFHELMMNACAHREEDPLVELLFDLPPWDGIKRLPYWLETCFDVADDSLELAEWASQHIFLGTVWRAMEPGTKLDEMVVLIGDPGIGKSTVLRYALPPELRYMFSDGLNLSAPPKERVESLQGRAITEIPEMQGARKADRESLKAFVSRTDDGSIRLAFRKNPEPMPRRSILVGTADRTDPLPDDRNLRRFVPVTLLSGDVGQAMVTLDRDRDDLWAEALHLYHQGVSARLPDTLKYAQAEATESARAKDTVLEDAIVEWLSTAAATFTTQQVARGVGLVEVGKEAKLSYLDSRRIGQVLRHQGYRMNVVKVEGLSKKRWMANPEDVTQ